VWECQNTGTPTRQKQQLVVMIDLSTYSDPNLSSCQVTDARPYLGRNVEGSSAIHTKLPSFPDRAYVQPQAKPRTAIDMVSGWIRRKGSRLPVDCGPGFASCPTCKSVLVKTSSLGKAR
jgi:hypothetical protein